MKKERETKKSTRYRKVADNFWKVVPLAVRDEQFDMGVVRVLDDMGHKCGTVHCAAGWYKVSKGLTRAEIEKGVVIYLAGVKEIARDVGVPRRKGQRGSAYFLFSHITEEIWGNAVGAEMFACTLAYTPGDKLLAGNLRDVAMHWDEVADRQLILELFEEGERDSRVTIAADQELSQCP